MTTIKQEELEKCLLEDKFDLYRQYNILRYNSIETIKTQNDGEHHATTTQLTVKIIEYLKGHGADVSDKTAYLATATASFHDLAEAVVGMDIPLPMKIKYPDLSEKSNELEHEAIHKFYGFGKVFDECQQDELAHAIYKLADAYDMLLFVFREYKLGNMSKDITTVKINACHAVEYRLAQLIEVLS